MMEKLMMEKLINIKVPYRKVTLTHYLDPYRDGIRLLPITIEKEKKLTNSYAYTYKASGYVEMMIPFDDTIEYQYLSSMEREAVIDEVKSRNIRHMICKITLDITIPYNRYEELLNNNEVKLAEYCTVVLNGYLTNDNKCVDLRNITTSFSTLLSTCATETFRRLNGRGKAYNIRVITKIEE